MCTSQGNEYPLGEHDMFSVCFCYIHMEKNKTHTHAESCATEELNNCPYGYMLSQIGHIDSRTPTDGHTTGVEVGIVRKLRLCSDRGVIVFASNSNKLPQSNLILSYVFLLLWTWNLQLSKFAAVFQQCLSTMPVNASHRSLSLSLSLTVYPCGLDLLEQATSHWVMLGSITGTVREQP